MAKVESDPELGRELDQQEAAVRAVRSVGLRELQDDFADQFADRVYNRLERRVGWWLVCAGLVALVGYILFELMTDPGIHTVYRVALAAILVGFGLLFSGVCRFRMKHKDRYSEVVR